MITESARSPTAASMAPLSAVVPPVADPSIYIVTFPELATNVCLL